MSYILFDIGGTKTRVSRSEDLEHFEEPVKFETPPAYQEGFVALSQAIESLTRNHGITAIAGGIRGPLNFEKTGIVSETKLSDWVGRNIVHDLAERYHVPVELENDTAIVGLGEAVFGAGKGYDIVAYHTVSTGVGGARIVDQKIDRASMGFEPGHQELDLDRSILGKRTVHSLENLVSGTALELRRGMKPYEIPQEDHVWDDLASYLAHGLKNTIVYWSPEIIVLGGSMIVGNPRILLEDIKRHTQEVLGDLVPCPAIVDAAFRDDGGLYGAMALLQQRMKRG
jgi:glucokinase